MTQTRLSGLLVAAFGLALLLVVIPDQVETVDYGWVRPGTLPNLLALALLILGLLQAALTPDPTRLELPPAARAAGYLGLAAGAVWAMGRLGFPWVAPAMVLAVMLLAGERRPLWLAIGALVLPGLVWLVVVPLLGRTLPG